MWFDINNGCQTTSIIIQGLVSMELSRLERNPFAHCLALNHVQHFHSTYSSNQVSNES